MRTTRGLDRIREVEGSRYTRITEFLHASTHIKHPKCILDPSNIASIICIETPLPRFISCCSLSVVYTNPDSSQVYNLNNGGHDLRFEVESFSPTDCGSVNSKMITSSTKVKQQFKF